MSTIQPAAETYAEKLKRVANTPHLTPDEVFAKNLKRLRGSMSRATLAEGVAAMSRSPWTESTIKDLEGARSSVRPPRSVRWTELIELAIYFAVPIFELVLPDSDTMTTIASATDIERRETHDGQPKTKTTTVHRWVDLDEMGAVLFRLPGAMLNEETLATYDFGDFDLAQSVAGARTTAEQLQVHLDRMQEYLQQHQEDNN
jgi:hypothetical protein